MTEEQKLRYELLRAAKDVEQAQEYYNFIMSGESKYAKVGPIRERMEDGVYLIYSDRYEKFNGNNDKSGVKYVGIVHDGHAIAVGLKDLGEHRLPYDSDLEKDDWKYGKGDVFAMNDFNGQANTEHLKRHGEFNFNLNDGEWLPSIGELAMIVLFKDEVNEALEYVGGDKFLNDYYWSSTEYNANFAWFILFSSALLYDGVKANNAHRCRPVAAFDFEL